MVEERDGWFVVNVKEATWWGHPAFGRGCSFEGEGRFPHHGVRLHVLEPGKPNCRYHRENAQEDFLVLSGECLLLVNGEERKLRAWDFVHCPPGTTHVFVGAGDGPCAVLMIGHRPGDHELYYPESELARRHGAETPEPTPDPRVAYGDLEAPREKIEPPEWPLGS
jgi:uncharacterized cupin superfamily protein